MTSQEQMKGILEEEIKVLVQEIKALKSQEKVKQRQLKDDKSLLATINKKLSHTKPNEEAKQNPI